MEWKWKACIFACSIALLVTVCASTLLPVFAAQAPSDPTLERKLQAGRDALGSRQWLRAITFFKEASQDAKGSCAECYLGLAATYSGNGQLQDAIDNCDRALQIATDDGSKATAHTIKGKALVELAAKDRDKRAQAESEFRAAAQIESGNPLFRLWLGTVLLRESKNEDGIAELKKCLALDPPAAVAQRARLILADPAAPAKNLLPTFASPRSRDRLSPSSNPLARSWSWISGRRGALPAANPSPNCAT